MKYYVRSKEVRSIISANSPTEAVQKLIKRALSEGNDMNYVRNIMFGEFCMVNEEGFEDHNDSIVETNSALFNIKFGD